MTRLVLAIGFEAVVLAALVVVGADIRAHRRVEELGGVNIWGYRGAVARQKQPNEIRVAIVGGTRAFGWGEPASAFASQLRRIVMLATDRPGRELRPVVVVNLGRLGALPDAYPSTIDHFAYLQPDYVCLYDDLGVRGAPFAERTSAVFETTGYSPILPLALREKGLAWRFGDVNSGYLGATPPTSPPRHALQRVAGRSLESLGGTLAAADRVALALVPRTDMPSHDRSPAAYAAALLTAINSAHQHARGVVLVLSPAETAEQAANRRALLDRLPAEFGSAAWLRTVDLDGVPELVRPDLRLDGWNYGSAAITRAAELIAPALVDLATTQ